jgi:hypothetical protein
MNPMSKAIVSGDFQATDTIQVTFEDDNLVFKCIPGDRHPDEDAPVGSVQQIASS